MKTRCFGVGVLLVLTGVALTLRRTDSRHVATVRLAPVEKAAARFRPAEADAKADEARLAICEGDFTGKRSPFWQAPGAGRLALTLPGGREVEVVIERTEWGGVERFVSRGHLEGQVGSVALIAYARGEVSGYFNAPEFGEFQLNGSTCAGAATITATGGLDCAGAVAAPPRARRAHLHVDGGESGMGVPPMSDGLTQSHGRDARATAEPQSPASSGRRARARLAAALDHADARDSADATTAAEAAQPAVTIDVLGLYLHDSFGANTTEDIAHSNFDLNIELCNRIYANSQIPLRLRLVRVAQTSYRETNATDPMRVIGDALDALRQRGDGRMDEIHALRDEAGADLVFLAMSRFAPGAGGPSGMSYIQFCPSVRSPRDWEANPEFGFCVVKARADNNFSALPHEIGHNFGCAHDRPNAGTGGGAFSSSFGYKFTAGNGLRYRTIMATGTENSALLFSSPRLTPPAYGVPVGVAEGLPGEADNAQTVARAMFEIAAFRLSADAPANHRLINVATRAWAGAGAEALIGGFIVAGDAPAAVVMRSLGPSLRDFGVEDAMANPTIELRRQTDGALVRRNDNWGEGDAVAALAASGLAPRAALEPAIHVMLPPGGYTAVVGAADGRAGNSIVEVFGVGGGEGGGRLGNLSTRGFVGGDGREMIGGFVVEGAAGETKRIAIRALGPSLRDFGVSGALDDPLIELHDSSGATLLVQDDFNSLDTTSAGGGARRSTYAQASVFAAGLQPGNRREPCVMLDLAAGAYTVVVRPVAGVEAGVALLEVFEITLPK